MWTRLPRETTLSCEALPAEFGANRTPEMESTPSKTPQRHQERRETASGWSRYEGTMFWGRGKGGGRRAGAGDGERRCAGVRKARVILCESGRLPYWGGCCPPRSRHRVSPRLRVCSHSSAFGRDSEGAQSLLAKSFLRAIQGASQVPQGGREHSLVTDPGSPFRLRILPSKCGSLR